MKKPIEQEVRTVRVLIADDNDGFRRVLASHLADQKDVKIVGEAAEGRDAISMAERL